MDNIELQYTLLDADGQTKKNSERQHSDIFNFKSSSEVEIKKGAQVLGTDLENRSLQSTNEEIIEHLPVDFQEFKKVQESDLAEAKMNLDRFKLQIDVFVKNMDNDRKVWCNKVNEIKDLDYLQIFQSCDECLATLEKQWQNLTVLFNQYVIEESKAEYRGYKKMEKIEQKESDDFDLEIKTVDEHFDRRTNNIKKVESLWLKYQYTENIYQFLNRFWPQKIPEYLMVNYISKLIWSTP